MSDVWLLLLGPIVRALWYLQLSRCFETDRKCKSVSKTHPYCGNDDVGVVDALKLRACPLNPVLTMPTSVGELEVLPCVGLCRSVDFGERLSRSETEPVRLERTGEGVFVRVK